MTERGTIWPVAAPSPLSWAPQDACHLWEEWDPEVAAYLSKLDPELLNDLCGVAACRACGRPTHFCGLWPGPTPPPWGLPRGLRALTAEQIEARVLAGQLRATCDQCVHASAASEERVAHERRR